MYQSVIRDPGGNSLIRVQPNLGDSYHVIVNGSILIVPPGTVAYVELNGMLSSPYGPGRYEIFTGVDPFFVRLRNAMTHGDPGTTLSVFFISTEKDCFLKFGTGEFPFREHRFQLTMCALASCNLTFSVEDPGKVLHKLIGSYSEAFSEEDLAPCMEQMVLPPIREALSKELAELEVTEFNGSLTRIGNLARPAVGAALAEYGLAVSLFAITAVNIPETELSRLYALEQTYADGKMRTDLELDKLQRIWNGSVDNRTLSEMMTGISARSHPGTQGVAEGPSSANTGGMAPMMMQMMLLSQLLPAMREPLSSMAQHTDLFGGVSFDLRENTAQAEAPPPMPSRLRRCPSCNGSVLRTARVCPICGSRL